MGNSKQAGSVGRADWRLHLIWGAVLALVLVIGFFSYKYSVDKVARGLERGLEEAKAAAAKAEAIAAAFKKGTISETFKAYIPVFESVGTGNLELVKATIPEVFRREDSQWAAWGLLYLGTTVSEIKVPVTYRYHLRFKDEWDFRLENGRLTVTAPKIRPSLPPAIHLDKMEKKTTSGWARSDKEENLEILEKKVMPRLEQYAGDEKHMSAVREECRTTVEKFLKAWLLVQPQWQEEEILSVEVMFADEIGGGETSSS